MRQMAIVQLKAERELKFIDGFESEYYDKFAKDGAVGIHLWQVRDEGPKETFESRYSSYPLGLASVLPYDFGRIVILETDFETSKDFVSGLPVWKEVFGSPYIEKVIAFLPLWPPGPPRWPSTLYDCVLNNNPERGISQSATVRCPQGHTFNRKHNMKYCPECRIPNQRLSRVP